MGFEAARAFALALPLLLLAGALGSEHVAGLYPCEMCHWQRWPHYAAVVLAALAFLVRGIAARQALVALAAVAIGVSGAIGVFHAGVEYGWWQGITGCTSTVSAAGRSVDELLADIMQAPMIRCDVPQWTWFGVSLAGFNALFSLAGAAAIAALLLLLPREEAGG